MLAAAAEADAPLPLAQKESDAPLEQERPLHVACSEGALPRVAQLLLQAVHGVLRRLGCVQPRIRQLLLLLPPYFFPLLPLHALWARQHLDANVARGTSDMEAVVL